MKRIIQLAILTIILPIASQAQQLSPLYKDTIQLKWVDEKYNSMSLEEKVGQLFIVAAYTNRDSIHENDIMKLIKNEHIGGLIFMQDQAVKQIDLTNKFQANSKVPLLIGVDGEWGLAMRLKGVERFPWNMTLGALRDNSLIYQVGKQIGIQANLLMLMSIQIIRLLVIVLLVQTQIVWLKKELRT
ncbi:MAG: glycoside hydrolase family 3 N-terminal domain-containing protein [Algoriella sp.]